MILQSNILSAVWLVLACKHSKMRLRELLLANYRKRKKNRRKYSDLMKGNEKKQMKRKTICYNMFARLRPLLPVVVGALPDADTGTCGGGVG